MIPFFKERYVEVSVFLILAVVIVVSFSTLTTKPRIWTDEAVTLEISRNIYLHGTLNAQPAPDEWYEAPYVLQSTGYPVTLSLAGVYSLFEYGFTQARVVMLIWMIVALLAVFMCMRSLFSKETALGSMLLIATFATFHADGRTATGEVPGFAFLVAGIYFWLARKNPWLAGALWGLAVVTKPSVFIFLIPTITLTLLLEPHPFLERIKNVMRVGIAMIPAGALWIFLVIPEPFSADAWKTIFSFLTNPYAATTHAAPGIAQLVLQPTIIYFALWSAVAIIAYRALTDTRHRSLYLFVGIFSGFAFLYYLNSPGWLRYFFIAELLILTILPSALAALQTRYGTSFPRLPTRYGAAITIATIALFQIAQFSTADIYESDTALRIAEYVNTNYATTSTLVMGNLGVFVLLENENRNVFMRLDGIKPLGEPLSDTFLPDVVLVENPDEGNNYFLEFQHLLGQHYDAVTDFGAFTVFKLSSH